MKRQAKIVVLGVLICVAGLAAVSVGGSQRPRRRHTRPDPSQAHVKMPVVGLTPPVSPAPVAEPAPVFRVDPLPDAKAESLKLHRQAADLITLAAPIPVARLMHFRWVQQTPGCQFRGWGGFVEDVQPVQGGYLATVRMSPMLTWHRCSASTGDYTVERYILEGRRVQLIEVIDPPGAPSGSLVTD